MSKLSESSNDVPIYYFGLYIYSQYALLWRLCIWQLLIQFVICSILFLSVMNMSRSNCSPLGIGRCHNMVNISEVYSICCGLINLPSMINIKRNFTLGQSRFSTQFAEKSSNTKYLDKFVSYVFTQYPYSLIHVLHISWNGMYSGWASFTYNIPQHLMITINLF